MNNCVKTVVRVSGVFDNTSGAIWINYGVGALNDISTARFVLGFAVPGMGVVDAVGEIVVGWGVRFGNYGFGYGGGVSYRSYSSGDGSGVGDSRSSVVGYGRSGGI